MPASDIALQLLLGCGERMLGVALAIRFSLEMCLVAVALWFPWQVWSGSRALIGSLALALLLMLTWGTFLSPKRRFEVGAAARMMLEAALFSLAAAALYSGGHWQVGAVLMGTACIDKLVFLRVEGRT